jgi:hypothetical protein
MPVVNGPRGGPKNKPLTCVISQIVVAAAAADFNGGKTSAESLIARRVTNAAAEASDFLVLRKKTILALEGGRG